MHSPFRLAMPCSDYNSLSLIVEQQVMVHLQEFVFPGSTIHDLTHYKLLKASGEGLVFTILGHET